MKRLRVLFRGVGGQGTLLASRLLGEAAMEQDIPVRMSEVHGMAQRGGVVESAVLLGGLESPLVAEGQADVLVSFEPLETLRALPKCSRRTTIVTNTRPILPYTVKSGQAAYPDVEACLDFLRRNYRACHAYDAEAEAEAIGSPKVVNVLLLGTLLGTGLVPLEPGHLRETIRALVKPRFVELNLAALDRGLALADGREAPA
ncbi:indolepyruvate oxidoreductase subunit beta [Dissulfurirhabdus thermomarina]|uniref:Indolepyruvate oxidoreductase subunit beta n=1 Tax=Dissulfurirhabdus thermomarina TaxID=1765737 RepID=A0A6N9TTD2_DISTH|nr:indolepyruvate oxidoreductase subunit beta [Dissulfurirhabdus thermomarina]NDY42994.1 indolepyruvate oxidoreductase subunit beta [Dissulfurirhabdus thermomarina]NMX22714.1 indolepyruvate oxidoreductase subunit beta [Dissulfurirhabdus thermomarina]